VKELFLFIKLREKRDKVIKERERTCGDDDDDDKDDVDA
jgi:hypothetical protein